MDQRTDGSDDRDGDGQNGRVLSFVIPAYNESAMIADTCAAVGDTCRSLVDDDRLDDWQIVVVDDGSTDDTGSICDGLAAADPRIVVDHRRANGGLGAAIRSGFARADGDFVLYTDADQPFDLRDTRTALELLHATGADIVAAFRLNRGGEGPRRWLYSQVYNRLIRARFSVDVIDVNFAAKLVRRSVLDAVSLQSTGSFIDAELLIRASRAGFQIVQFGTCYHPRTRGVSTLSSLRTIATMLKEMQAQAPGMTLRGRGRQSSTDG